MDLNRLFPPQIYTNDPQVSLGMFQTGANLKDLLALSKFFCRCFRQDQPNFQQGSRNTKYI